jgi:hypothetical protein
MGDRNRAGIGLSYRPARLHTQPGGVGSGSLESIFGLLDSLKIRAQFLPIQHIEQSKCIKLIIDTNKQLKLYNASHFLEGP